MKVTMTAASLAAACALAAGPIASAQAQGQGQGQGQRQSRQTPPPRSDMQPSLVLSGCLERDTAAASAASGATTQTSTQASFKLTNITVVPTAAAVGYRTRGQQTSTARAAKDERARSKEYRLTAAPGVDLSEHVGYEVEVAGIVAKRDVTTGTGTGRQQQRTVQREADKGLHPLLTVSSVRMIATTCRSSF